MLTPVKVRYTLLSSCAFRFVSFRAPIQLINFITTQVELTLTLPSQTMAAINGKHSFRQRQTKLTEYGILFCHFCSFRELQGKFFGSFNCARSRRRAIEQLICVFNAAVIDSVEVLFLR